MKKGQTLLVVSLTIVIISLFIMIFILIDVGSKGDKSITGNVFKSFGINKCKEVQVPYNDVEEYTYYLKAEVISSKQHSGFGLVTGVYTYGVVNLKNVDNDGGWFTVEFNWITLNNQKTDRVRHYIKPDETVEFTSFYDINMGEDSKFDYSYKSDPIKRTRVITKYRAETKCD